MGNFYTNIVVAGAGAEKVAAELRRLGREAYVAATPNGHAVVYDAECEDQDVSILDELGAGLSKTLGAPVWAALNNDDDVLVYRVIMAGKTQAEYCSNPGLLGEDGDDVADDAEPDDSSAPILAAAFGNAKQAEPIAEILRKAADYTFAIDLHRDLAAALGLPPDYVCAGFNYIEDDDVPEGLEVESLIRVGGG